MSVGCYLHGIASKINDALPGNCVQKREEREIFALTLTRCVRDYNRCFYAEKLDDEYLHDIDAIFDIVEFDESFFSLSLFLSRLGGFSISRSLYYLQLAAAARTAGILLRRLHENDT